MNRPDSAIRIARAYALPQSPQYYRVLVDRLWPRGVKKEALQLDQWAKEVAPSHELRKWFNHDLEKWSEFRQRYLRELAVDAQLKCVRELLNSAGDKPILLIYAAKDTSHNNAIVLKEYLERMG
ncbi:DUF488 domain-containing protein [Aureliella helgolandensis]|uniref:Uncharacterized protein n=1 Tax=Aureliella helgolandensis TaxID=2527968 RepID=A0A518G955_9BACT|nr:DUF488 family protein [Aureliella helgolandensis]QDV25103.1 hypothetical protein Q31a_34260 [Aureliella helgolandensis]